jgi:hypothetical protein
MRPPHLSLQLRLTQFARAARPPDCNSEIATGVGMSLEVAGNFVAQPGRKICRLNVLECSIAKRRHNLVQTLLFFKRQSAIGADFTVRPYATKKRRHVTVTP